MIKALLFIAFGLLLSFTTEPNPEKEYTAKGTLSEWQILLAHPDDVAKSTRDKVVAKFVGQLQRQIAVDTIKKK